jgi:hypothetical protein
LYESLSYKIEIIERREFSKNKPVLRKRWQLDFQYAGNKPLSIKNAEWKFVKIDNRYLTPQYIFVKFDQIKSLPDADHSYSLQFLITKQIAVKIGYQSGRYTFYEPPADLTKWGVSDHKYRIHFDRLFYGLSYYFTKKTGFRPFVSFALGTLNLRPKMIDTIYYYDYAYKPYLKNKKSQSYILTFGSDYVDESSPFVVGIRFVYSRFLEKVMYLSNDIFNIQITAGMVF